jgi:WD40 repeat protein
LDGEHIVCASAFNTVRVYDTATRREMFQLAGHVNWVSLAVVSLDNRTLVTCSLDNTIKVWNLEHGRDPPALADGDFAEGIWIPTVAFDQSGGHVFTGSDDHKLRAYDLATGKKSGEWAIGDARSLVLSPDGKTLAVGFDDDQGNIGFFDLATKGLGRKFKAHNDSLKAVAFSADGRRLASASEDGTAKVWDVATETLLATCRGHTGYVNSVAFHPDGTQLVTAGKDGTVRSWDIATGAETRRMTAHGSSVTCVAISPDGRWMATANENRERRNVSTEIKIWNPNTGELLQTMTGHTNSIWHLAFSPDGDRLASCGEDTTIKIWDPAHGDLLLSLKRHFDDVRCVAFSRDGRRLASSGDDPFLRVWDATPLP